MRKKYLLDNEWRFVPEKIVHSGKMHSESYYGCKAGGIQGIAGRNFDDSQLRMVNIPHDYLTEVGFDEIYGSQSHGYKKTHNAWYRKTFRLDNIYADKHIYLCFEGISVFSEIYFNGSLLKRSFSAYSEIDFDVSDRAYFKDVPNVISVHVNAIDEEGWWYEGAGIYRNAYLYIKDKLHIAHNGMFFKPVFNGVSWDVKANALIENTGYDSDSFYIETIISDENNEIAHEQSDIFTVSGNEKISVDIEMHGVDAEFWDVDNPKLYKAKMNIYRNGELIDDEETNIGFRIIEVNEEGFILNGRKVYLIGTCNHQDHAGVGVAVPYFVNEYRIKRLKELGTNAYRCSHNPPTKDILDICDKYGMIVLDENRRFETGEEYIEQLETFVKRDRNHPSVVFYSLFNEEPYQGTSEGAKIYRRLKSRLVMLDDSRIVLGAASGGALEDEGTLPLMDIIGINYNYPIIDLIHNKFSDKPIILTESNSAIATRSCLKTDEDAHTIADFDEDCVSWGYTTKSNYKFVNERPFIAGFFVWTGFDYRGEPTPYEYPSQSSYFGIMDTCGFNKNLYYYSKAYYNKEPFIKIISKWNWNDGENINIKTVTNLENVELFLNGKSLGVKKSEILNQCSWDVQFIYGELKAVAFNDKVEVEDRVVTSGKADTIKLIPVNSTIKNNGIDGAIINVCVTDKQANIVLNADNKVSFRIEGDAVILGTGNGNQNSLEIDAMPERRLFEGWCQVIIRGEENAKAIKLIAESENLKSAETVFEICEAEKPMRLTSIDAQYLTNWRIYANEAEKPDSYINVEDNDMNTFIPYNVSDAYISTFTQGYRLFEINVRTEKETFYSIYFSKVNASKVELYADGNLITCKNDIKNSELKLNFKAENKQTLIRILMKADIDGKQSGFKNYVSMGSLDK